MAMNLDRTFGIEIEFIGDRGNVAQGIRDLGLRCEIENYNHNTRPHWKITSDSSVHPNANQAGYGWELVSPILKGRDGLEQIRKVCEALESAGAKVNRSCGLHVHHDARDFQNETFKNLIKIYARFEPVIDTLVAPSRRGNVNQYCQTLARIDLENVLNAGDPTTLRRAYGDRYKKLNLQSYVTHGTVEFRQHQGTINAEKIINWVKLTQGIVERAVARPVKKCGPRTRKDWETFKYFLFLNPSSHNPNNRKSSYDEETKEMIKYFNKRRKELNKEEAVAA
jgi:hypothetical protein